MPEYDINKSGIMGEKLLMKQEETGWQKDLYFFIMVDVLSAKHTLLRGFH